LEQRPFLFFFPGLIKAGLHQNESLYKKKKLQIYFLHYLSVLAARQTGPSSKKNQIRRPKKQIKSRTVNSYSLSVLVSILFSK